MYPLATILKSVPIYNAVLPNYDSRRDRGYGVSTLLVAKIGLTLLLYGLAFLVLPQFVHVCGI